MRIDLRKEAYAWKSFKGFVIGVGIGISLIGLINFVLWLSRS